MAADVTGGHARRAASRAIPRALPVVTPAKPYPWRNSHPHSAPVLSRPRSPSRALATLASQAMAPCGHLNCDLARFTFRAYQVEGHEMTTPGHHPGSGSTPRPRGTKCMMRAHEGTSLVQEEACDPRRRSLWSAGRTHI